MSRAAQPGAARLSDRWGLTHARKRIVRTGVAWLIVVAVAALVAVVAVGDRKIGLALAALVLVLGLLVADPLLLVVIALPGALLIQRVGGTTTNLSAADLLVFVGAVVALFHIHWKDAPHLREFMRGIVWFQAVLILVVIVHPFRGDVVEWLHRWSYLAGSVLVGWVIATHGRTRQAFRLFLAGSSVVALIAMEHAVTGHFKPAQWGVYQKNAIGAILLIAILIAQINPPWAHLGRIEVRVNKYLCIGGLLASQSRQSVILLILALSVSYILNPELRRRSKLLLLGAIPLIVVLYYSFTINARNNPEIQFGLDSGRPDRSRRPCMASQPDPRPRHAVLQPAPVHHRHGTAQCIHRQPRFHWCRRLIGVCLHALRHHASNGPPSLCRGHPRPGRPAQPLRRRPL